MSKSNINQQGLNIATCGQAYMGFKRQFTVRVSLRYVTWRAQRSNCKTRGLGCKNLIKSLTNVKYAV